MLCAMFGWNWPSGSGEEVENVKSLQMDRQTDRRTDRQTDDRQQAIKKAHVSFQLGWAKKNYAAKVIHTGTSSKLKVNQRIRLLKGT